MKTPRRPAGCHATSLRGIERARRHGMTQHKRPVALIGSPAFRRQVAKLEAAGREADALARWTKKAAA